MTRYFLDLTNSLNHTDERGHEYASLHDARAEAVRYAGQLLLGETETLVAGHDLRVDVTDENNEVLFSVRVHTVLHPQRTPPA